MKVLLLNPPGERPYIRDNYCSYSSKANYYWEPIDLLVQSGRLGGHSLEVLDAIAFRLSQESVLSKVRDGGYDAVLSLIGSVSYAEDSELFRKMREVSKARIAVSGDICLQSSEKLLNECPEIDAAVLDYTTPDLARFLAEGGQGRPFQGLAYREGGHIVPAQPGDREETMSYPVPRHELFPLRRYRISTSISKKFVTCIASQGCNFNCPFCICSVMKLKLRGIDNLLEELHRVKALGVSDIYFYDPNFTVRRTRCLEMLQAVIDVRLGISFSCNSHITVDQDVIAKLKEAGCHTIMFGIENADDSILKQYSKGITRNRIRETLASCRGLGLRTFGYFLIGLPGETEQTIRETIDFATELPLNFASFNLPSPVEGTGLYAEAKKAGVLKEAGRTLDRSNEVSITLPGMSEQRLLDLKRSAYRRFYLRPRFLLSSFRDLYPLSKWNYLIADLWAFARRNFF